MNNFSSSDVLVEKPRQTKILDNTDISLSNNSVVSSYDEWGTLEEVVVGRVENAIFAPLHPSVAAVIPKAASTELPAQGIKSMPDELIDLANEELNHFVSILEHEGVKVQRPEIFNHSKEIHTPHWSSGGLVNACPRDGFLIIGDEIIETPIAWRSRYYEAFAFRKLFRDYFDRGAKWTAAPKPELLDSLYKEDFKIPDKEEPMDYVINESEIVFDAADFIRCGKDIFCQLSNVTNKVGIKWLRRHFGDQYRIHILDTLGWRNPMHIDASFVPLRPGLALINPDDFSHDTLPEFVKQWDLIVAPKPNKTSGTKFSKLNMCSDWLSANILSLDENRIIVEEQQTSLVSLLKDKGFSVIPCPFEHYSPFGGAFHCATLDIRRMGKLESYFDI